MSEILHLEWQISCPFTCEGLSLSSGLGFICCGFDLCGERRYAFQVRDTQWLAFLSGLLQVIVLCRKGL